MGARDPSRRALDNAASRLTVEKRGRAAVFSLPQPLAIGSAIAVIGLCASIYCAVGYVHYMEVAGIERASAERAERANAELQAALAQLRDNLGAAAGAIDRAGTDRAGTDKVQAATLPIAGSELDRTDRGLSLSRPFGSLDRDLTAAQPAPLAAALADPPVKFANGHLLQAWAQISRGPSEESLRQLSAEYAAIVDERDQLRQRVSDLEQQLSLLEPGPVPSQDAPARQDSTAATSAAGGLAAIAFPGAAAAGPGAGQSSRVLKNFVAPASVPDHFSNESGAILESPSSQSGREQR